MDTNNLEKAIQPFFWVEHENHENSVSVCLIVGKYKAEVFKIREDDGFQGNGYDWTSLARVFLDEIKPNLVGIVLFDPEADMFCAHSTNTIALKDFIFSFKDACENDELIIDLFSRAELD